MGMWNIHMAAVVSHHILQRPDLPAISNGLSGSDGCCPALACVFEVRPDRLMCCTITAQQSKAYPLPRRKALRFVAALAYGAGLATAFSLELMKA